MYKLSAIVYRFIKWVIRTVYPEIEVEGIENLPEEAAITSASSWMLLLM